MRKEQRDQIVSTLVSCLDEKHTIFFDFYAYLKNNEYNYAYDKLDYEKFEKISINSMDFEVGNTKAMTISNSHDFIRFNWCYFAILPIKNKYGLALINSNHIHNLKQAHPLVKNELISFLNFLLKKEVPLFDRKGNPLVGYAYYEYMGVRLKEGRSRYCLLRYFFNLSDIIFHVEVKHLKDCNRYMKIIHGSVYCDVDEIFENKLICPYDDNQVTNYSQFMKLYGSVSWAAQNWVIIDKICLG